MDPNADDLALLELLKRAEPAIITVSGDDLYAAAYSIPHEVLEAFEALTPSVKYIKVGTAWCLPVGDWVSCSHRLISKLMARMTSRSLELGITGPTPDDLEHATALSSWIAIQDPQHSGAILVGLHTGHPTIRGPLINTSRLCGIDTGKAWARSASRWYRLNDPATSENLVEQLGQKAAILDVFMLEFWEIQALIAEHQTYEGLRDV